MTNQVICKVLLFSDPHFSVDSKKYEQKWFPPLCDIMPKWMTIKFLKFWDNMTQRAFKKALLSYDGYGPFDLVIGCGDYTPGTNEMGMITDEAVKQYEQFQKSFYTTLGYAPSILVWGDHDVGYKFEVSGKTGVKIGTESGGMSVLSVHRAQDLIGPAFGELDLGVKKIVYISTNLIRNVDNTSDSYLQNLKCQQEDFVEEILVNARDREIIFFLHDPTALNFYEGVGESLLTHSKKIDTLLHGHMHARWNAQLMRVVYKPYRQLCKMFPVYVIPATWGMMGIGKGFGVMEILDDESIKFHWFK